MSLPSNISKTLCYSMYLFDVDDAPDAEALLKLLGDICELIGGTSIQTMSHDFEPYGATAVMMISESHLTAHTYPNVGPDKILRIDIDISGCGSLTPLISLSYLLDQFHPDIVTVNHHLRGFDWDDGIKWDAEIGSIDTRDYVIKSGGANGRSMSFVIHKPGSEPKVMDVVDGL